MAAVFLQTLLRTQTELAVENLAFRQQLAVLVHSCTPFQRLGDMGKRQPPNEPAYTLTWDSDRLYEILNKLNRIIARRAIGFARAIQMQTNRDWQRIDSSPELMTPKKPYHLSAKAVIRDYQGRCLVLRRSAASKHNAGCWDFPGGKTDPGETFDVALAREVVEETGLTVTLEKVLGSAESELADRRVAYLIMEAKSTGGEVRLSSEHDDFAWLTTTELAESNLCPQFVDFARSLNKTD